MSFRWIAIIFGLFGVILILRPTGDGFSPYVLFAVLGMLGFVGRDLGSRAASPNITDENPTIGLFFGLTNESADSPARVWLSGIG